MEEVLKDERFSHILTDPRFRKIPKHVKKITVDKRFKGMFKDEMFSDRCLLDKRGRPLNLTASENLKNLYQVSSESSEEEQDEDGSKNLEDKQESDSVVNKIESFDYVDSLENNESKRCQSLKKDKENLKDDHDDNDSGSHGESSEDDSSDDESEDSEENDDDDFDHHWEELRNEAPDTDIITHRLAVCNMDWDRIRAEDLFMCFNSFTPTDGQVNSLKIYPSEFGLKRMEEERLKGPPELVEEKLPLDNETAEDRKLSKYHREKLRQYQLNRLKYYYAVVDCDSPDTANVLCKQLNGMEYESSANRFDLRFVPDDMTFDQEPISVVDKVLDGKEYKPRLFITTALQQVKVDLTWDETSPKRKETLQKAFTDPDDIEKDLAEYLASSSGESENELSNKDGGGIEKLSTKERIAKYKELLLSLEEKDKEDKDKYEMEISWDPELKEKTEEIVKDKLKKEAKTPFEEKLQKRKEERKLKRKEKKALKQNVDGDTSVNSSEDSDDRIVIRDDKHSKNRDQDKNLATLALMSDSKKVVFEEKSKKKKKIKEQKMDDFKCNVNDPRFSAIYTSHLFNIDPSDPHFKRTEGNMALIQEKQRKLQSSVLEKSFKNKKRRYS